VASIYTERLLRESVVGGEVVERIRRQIQERMNLAHEEATRSGDHWELQEVTELEEAEVAASCTRTAISQDVIEKIVEGITTFPDTFHLHPKLKKFIDNRRALLDGGVADWAMGEALAFGSLVLEGTPVRLSGQDSGRGTFSQLWEAQFGDFVNVAQPIIDQFLIADRAKWGQDSSLVLLLPHGYEGQGPEHSSARLNRFLQLCAEDNMCVANLTTPAQYFHLLRRQELLEARKQREATNVAIIRLEQFYPWPSEDIEKMLWRYPSTADVIWVQEEPRNMGGWFFVRDRMQPMLDATRRTLLFAGRLEAASPAAGSLKRHQQEQAGVIEDAFTTGTVRRRGYRVVARRKEEE
jgi:2-oxoglutarate dehydrogenase complex dehydrogenase (E1) component-like enzyme